MRADIRPNTSAQCPPKTKCAAGSLCFVHDSEISDPSKAEKCSACDKWMHMRCSASPFDNVPLCHPCQTQVKTDATQDSQSCSEQQQQQHTRARSPPPPQSQQQWASPPAPIPQWARRSPPPPPPQQQWNDARASPPAPIPQRAREDQRSGSERPFYDPNYDSPPRRYRWERRGHNGRDYDGWDGWSHGRHWY
jgi:hypothetical protein